MDYIVGLELSPDQLTLYFTAAENGVQEDLYQARRASPNDPFGPPEPLSTVNTSDREFLQTVSSDGLTIIYETDRDADFVVGLLAATRDSIDDPFGPPRLIHDLWPGSEVDRLRWGEFTPRLAPDWPADGSKLYFGAGTDFVDWNIYEATWQAIPEPCSGLLAMWAIWLTGSRRRRQLDHANRTLGRYSVSVLATALATFAATHWQLNANAETLLFDDFSDGSYTDGMPARWSPRGTPQLDASSGDLRISARTSGCCPAAILRQSITGDLSVQTRAQIVDGGLGIGAKFNEATSDGYFWQVEPDNDLFFLARVNGIEYPVETGTTVPPRDNEDIFLQLDVVGNEVAGWYWTENAERPSEPQLQTTLSHPLIEGGIVGFYVWDEVLLRYAHIADSPIPEPSTLAIVLSALAVTTLRPNCSCSLAISYAHRLITPCGENPQKTCHRGRRSAKYYVRTMPALHDDDTDALLSRAAGGDASAVAAPLFQRQRP